MLLVLAFYVGAAAAFYAFLVGTAKREPERLEDADTKWPDRVQSEIGLREKAA